MGDLTLTREFLRICCDGRYKSRKVLVVSDLPEHNTPFISSAESSILEIVVFKSSSVKVFQECHAIFDAFLHNGQKITSEQHMATVLFATIGLMLTTNENHTAISVHNEILWTAVFCDKFKALDPWLEKVHVLQNELMVLQAVLTSNVNRLNKSSSLWQLLKRLYIHTLDQDVDIPREFFIDTVLSAAKVHRSNYYAWNFLRFVIELEKIRSGCILGLMELVLKWAKMNREDASAWACYTECVQVSGSGLQLVCDEYNLLARRKKLNYSYGVILARALSINEHILSLNQWLWKTKCTAEVPYKALARLLRYGVHMNKTLVAQVMEQAVVHCSLMEEVWLRQRGVQVIVERGFFTADVDLDKDLELRDEISSYFQWKRLVDWHTKFIFEPFKLIDTVQ